jgi:acetoacetate decarboxylase
VIILSFSFKKSYEEIEARNKRFEGAEFYDAELVSVFWLTKQEIIENLLPPPLKPVKYPLVVAFVSKYPKTNFGLAYDETALFIRCQYEGVQGNYCLAMHLEGPGSDLGMAGGRENLGFPKKLARVHFNKEGKNFVGWSERHGVRNLDIKVNITNKSNAKEALTILAETDVFSTEVKNQIAYNFKFFANPEGTGYDYNPKLVKQETLFRTKELEIGEAELKLGSSVHDPWAELEIVKLLGAAYTKGHNTMLRGTVVAEVDSIKFLPYGFLKWDWF